MLQKQATYRRTPPDLKFTIERAGEEGGGESEYCIPTSAPFYLPSVSPSLVHCTRPARLATSHSTTAVPPLATSTSRGLDRKNCCCAAAADDDEEGGCRRW